MFKLKLSDIPHVNDDTTLSAATKAELKDKVRAYLETKAKSAEWSSLPKEKRDHIKEQMIARIQAL